MRSKIKILSALLALLTLFCFSSCDGTYSDDAIAIAGYLQYFDKPEDVVVNKIEKSVFENETIYYISRSKYDTYEADEIELLIVYDPQSKTTKTAFFLDMEHGLHADIKAAWDTRAANAISTQVFSQDEIKNVTAQAAEYCQRHK